MNKSNPTILLTIDVEDWFQVENFKKHIPFSSWSNYKLRVEKNVYRLLDLFDSVEVRQGSQLTVHGSRLATCKENTDRLSADGSEQCQVGSTNNGPQSTGNLQKKKILCTFFVLGWLAKRLPHLVREIHSRGHEVASHGYSHDLCYECSNDELRKDLSDSKKLLEDVIGLSVYGYRAPSFSINNDILKIIEACGYLYDSSYNSFGLHGRYGKLDLSSYKRKGISFRIPRTKNSTNPNNSSNQSNSRNPSACFYELPISNLHIRNPYKYKLSDFRPPTSDINSAINPKDFILPWGGGGYFRLIPLPIFKKGVSSILKKTNAYMFYLHPWEIDPGQPRVNEASAFFKFRHYINLKSCQSKLFDMINAFRNLNFITCHHYLNIL